MFPGWWCRQLRPRSENLLLAISLLTSEDIAIFCLADSFIDGAWGWRSAAPALPGLIGLCMTKGRVGVGGWGSVIMVSLILEAGCMWDRVNLAQCIVLLSPPNCTWNYRCLLSASMLCNLCSAEPKLQTVSLPRSRVCLGCLQLNCTTFSSWFLFFPPINPVLYIFHLVSLVLNSVSCPLDLYQVPISPLIWPWILSISVLF